MKVKEVYNKTKNLEHYKLASIDFEDSFSTINKIDDLETISDLVFGQMPKWVQALMKLRNVLVRFIGLKTEAPKSVIKSFELGSHIGFFEIMAIHENEIVLGANDSHLNFRALISRNNDVEYNICMTTLVEYNNKLGRIYLAIIGPFHRLVVKNMVKQAYRN